MKYHCGIYKIKNIITGDFYIGQSIDLKKREYQHFYELKKNKHYNKYLQNSFNKYRKENFIFKTILYCDKNNLTFYEQLLVDNLNPTFNLCLECIDTIKGTKIKSQSLTRIKNIQHKNRAHKEYDNMYDEYDKDDEPRLCENAVPILYGKIPKLLLKGKYIYNDHIFRKMFLVQMYPLTLLTLYIYKNQMKNKRHSKIILKYFKKYKKSYFYNSVKNIVIRTRFKKYPDKLMRKVFHNIIIQENNNYISIYVNKKCFKHLYIIYF